MLNCGQKCYDPKDFFFLPEKVVRNPIFAVKYLTSLFSSHRIVQKRNQKYSALYFVFHKYKAYRINKIDNYALFLQSEMIILKLCHQIQKLEGGVRGYQ